MTDYADSIKHVEDYIRLPLLYNHWYVAGTCDEFDRDPKARTLLERSIVFYRTTDGQLVASQNRCLHRAFPLSESKLDGDELVCGYHGIRYNPEGLDGSRVPSQKKCPDRKLRMYPVVEQGPFVFIWMGDEDAPDMERLPDFPFLANPEMLTLHGQHHLDGSYLLMQENLNDLTHFAYLHHDSAGFDDAFLELPTVHRGDARRRQLLPRANATRPRPASSCRPMSKPVSAIARSSSGTAAWRSRPACSRATPRSRSATPTPTMSRSSTGTSCTTSRRRRRRPTTTGGR